MIESNKDALGEAIAARMLRNMNSLMLVAQGDVVKSISRSNHGGGNPSRPGEPPKAVSNTLRRTIRGTAFRRGNDIVGRISAGTRYAKRLELGFVGTDKRGRRINQKPRPFLRPGLTRAVRERGDILTR